MDCSLPGSSLHGILQARILEWVTISFSRESSQLRDQTPVSCTAGRHFNLWATREAHTFFFLALVLGKRFTNCLPLPHFFSVFISLSLPLWTPSHFICLCLSLSLSQNAWRFFHSTTESEFQTPRHSTLDTLACISRNKTSWLFYKMGSWRLGKRTIQDFIISFFSPCKYLSNLIYSALIPRNWNPAEAVKLSLGALEVMIKHRAEENPGDVRLSVVHVLWNDVCGACGAASPVTTSELNACCLVLLLGQLNKLSSIFLMRSSQLYSSKFLKCANVVPLYPCWSKSWINSQS